MRTAQFALEGGLSYFAGLAGLGSDDDVSVCRFPVQGRRNASIVEATEVDVKEG